MALDTTNLTRFLKGITDAIRSKTGSTDPIEHEKIDEEIMRFKTQKDAIRMIGKIIDCNGSRTDYTRACHDLYDFNFNIFRNNDYMELKLDTSKGVKFNSMFIYDNNFKTIPELDTSNGIDFSEMFCYATSLISIPALDTSKGKIFYKMFSGAQNLTTINGVLSFEGTSDLNTFCMFEYCTSLQTVKFVENTIKFVYSSAFDIHYSSHLSDESIDSIIKALCQNESGRTWTLRLHSDVIKKLTDEQVLEVTNKNWELG